MKESTGKNLERIVELMRTDESMDAPAASVKYAKDLFRLRAAEPQPSILRRIMAAITVDR